MKLQLNPSLETFLLLLQQNWGKAQKKEVIKQLDDFGINGAAFYAAQFPLVERYYSAFASRMAITGASAIFKDLCEELALLLLIILTSYPEWLSDFSAISDEEIHAAVEEAVASFLECKDEIIGALGASELSDHAKWQISALVQQPKQKLVLIIEAVNTNLTAFEYAYTKLEAEIVPLLTQMKDQLEKSDLPPIVHQALTLSSNCEVIPSLAAPLMVSAFDEYCFAGLLINRVFTGQDDPLSDSEAVIIAKSLSDPSKLEILHALKKEKLYNREIAQKLELTPATISHHMNMLLSTGLVEVTREGSKVYYSLCTNGVTRYRSWLDESFLHSD